MADDYRLVAPKKDAKAAEIAMFFDAYTDNNSTSRRERVIEWLTSKAYKEGVQWVERNAGDNTRMPAVLSAPGNGGVGKDGIPKPVTNRVMPAWDNEVARLSKRNSELYVDPDGSDPSKKAGAKVAQEALLDHYENIGYARKLRRTIENDGLYGIGIQRSYLEKDNLDLVTIGIPEGAKSCACGAKLASDEVPAEAVTPMMARILTSEPVQNKEGDTFLKYKANACPTCGGPLQDYAPTPAMDVADLYGRPLTTQVPKGKPMVENVSPYNFFPENEGLGIEPESLTSFVISTPRSLDWVKRYFQKNTKLVRPEDPVTIAESHPVMGEFNSTSKGTRGAGERTIYRNHVRVRQYFQGRTMDFPMGRYIAMAGNVVIADEDLYIKVPPVNGKPQEPLPKVVLGICRIFPKDGELWGQGFPVHIISLQNRINMTDSQMVDNRQHSIGGILATNGMNLVRGWMKGMQGLVFRYDADPGAQGQEPKPFRTGIPDRAGLEENRYATEAIGDIVGVNDAETGSNAHDGVTAYSAIALKAAKSSERREQREKEIINMVEEVGRHQLKLMQYYYREPRPYKAKPDSGSDAQLREFIGSDIAGQTGLRVREMPQYDKDMAEREALSAWIQNPQFAPTTAAGKRAAMKILGAPTEIMDEQNVQIDEAERKWLEFLRKGVVPIVDPNLDDPTIHYQELGRLLLSEDGLTATRKSGWWNLLKYLASWEQELMETQLQAMNAKAMGWIPGTPLAPVIQQQYEMAMAAYEQEKALWDNSQKIATLDAQAAALTGAPGPEAAPAPTDPAAAPTGAPAGAPAQQAPVPPMPPAIVPNPRPALLGLEHMIAWTMRGMLMRCGVQVPPECEGFLDLRAAFEAYHMMAEGQQGGQVAAPGAETMGAAMPAGAPPA